MRGARVGSLIGAVGGLVFVLVNAAALPSGPALAARVLGVVGFVAVLWFAVLHGPEGTVEPSRAAIRTYTVCVVAEVLAIPLGATLLDRVVHRPELVLPWVVLVVGAHFVPFAQAFGAPLFARLGFALAAVALVGAVACVAVDGPEPGRWAAVLAGFVLLGFSGYPARHA